MTVSSYLTYHYLKKRDFDLVLFPDWRGLGYYTLQAKKLGLAFQKTALWIQAHSTCLWHALSNQQTSFSSLDTRVYHMERRSVEMADLVVSPTQYLLNWKLEHGFRFPEDTYVQPYLLTGLLATPPATRHKIEQFSEIVFFGRLEKRKGLHIFVQAVKRLARDIADPAYFASLTFTFMGKITEIDFTNSYDYVVENLEPLGCKIKLLTSLSSVEAVDYLKASRRLAVIPSVSDNSPLTVLECIHNEIPFIAAATGGIPEIICADDHPNTLFRLGARYLAEKLRHILTNGTTTAFPAVNQDAVNIPEWLAAIRTSVHRQQVATSTMGPVDEKALISVCITHFNRPHYLEITLDGLVQQTHKNFEVIIVDDGSTTVEAVQYINNLEDAELPFPVTIIRQKNEFVGAARNKALDRARGEYIVFMDDDNFAHPEQLRTFLACIQRGGYGALSCVAVAFPEDDDPRSLSRLNHLYIPLGCGPSANLFENNYGDANGIFRTQLLKDLGGFTEDEGLSWEDYELFSKIELSGNKMGVIPEALMYLRHTVGSVSRRGSQVANYYRALRPALKMMPWHNYGDALLVSLNRSLANFAAISEGGAPHRSVTEKQLLRSVEFSVTGLRWLVRRMAERNGEESIITTLMEHYHASPVFAYSIVECFFYCLRQGMTPTKIINLLGKTPSTRPLVAALAEAVIKQDLMLLRDVLNTMAPAVGRTLDGKILLAKINILEGNVVEGLRSIRDAFAEVEKGYLASNPDLIKHFKSVDPHTPLNSRSLRSGMHHWHQYGQFEGRAIDYCRPLCGPLSLYDLEVPVDYERRIREAKEMDLETRGNVYAQLITECLEINAPLMMADLANVILQDGNQHYLDEHLDVKAAVESNQFQEAAEHYCIFGRSETRQTLFRVLEARRYGPVFERFWEAHRNSLNDSEPSANKGLSKISSFLKSFGIVQ